MTSRPGSYRPSTVPQIPASWASHAAPSTRTTPTGCARTRTPADRASTRRLSVRSASPAQRWVSAARLSARSAYVPHRLAGLADFPVRTEQHEPVEPPGEPPVVSHRDHGAGETLQALFEGLR